MTAALAFSPDPWLWRRTNQGTLLHAVRDEDFLPPPLICEAACGRSGWFPLGPAHAKGRPCPRCERAVEAQR